MTRAAGATRDAETGPVGRRLASRSRVVRLVAVAVVLVVLAAGSVFGSDDDFPFGPFHMYSTRTSPDSVARELRVQLITSTGHVIDVTNTPGAPRRAELEGRIGELQGDLAAVRRLVPLYTAHVSQPTTQLRLVWENHPLHNGRTAAPYDTVICTVPVQP